MKNVVSRDWQWNSLWRPAGAGPMLMKKQPTTGVESFALRLAREGEWVRIVSFDRGKALHERLAGFGLRVGAEVQVLHNAMSGKILPGHQGARLYLGGGMAHKIQVVVTKRGNR